eukprot:2683675-Ditylum_brightwellii.AAC.1
MAEKKGDVEENDMIIENMTSEDQGKQTFGTEESKGKEETEETSLVEYIGKDITEEDNGYLSLDKLTELERLREDNEKSQELETCKGMEKGNNTTMTPNPNNRNKYAFYNTKIMLPPAKNRDSFDICKEINAANFFTLSKQQMAQPQYTCTTQGTMNMQSHKRMTYPHLTLTYRNTLKKSL